jgi:hypothetical protein
MKCVQFMEVFLLVYFAFASTNCVWTLWSVPWIWNCNSLYVQSPSSYTPQSGSLVYFLRAVFRNIDNLLLCDKCAVWKYIDTSETPSSYEASILNIHPTQSHPRQLLYSHCCETLELHPLKMILVFISILSCYGSLLLSTEILYKNPQPCWLLFEELLPAISNKERNCINKCEL